MNLSDLTRDELLLVNTDFGSEIEKVASEIANEEFEKDAEVEGVADSCLVYGAELAMQKIAEMEEKHKKAKEEGEEDEEEEEKEEEEKTADAMGNFILEGYWNTMMEKGAEFYGDENIYIEELCKEAGKAKQAKTFWSTVTRKAKKAAKPVTEHFSKVKGDATSGYKGVKSNYKSYKKSIAKGEKSTNLFDAEKNYQASLKAKKNILKNLKKTLPAAGYGAGAASAVGLGAYGTHRALS